MPRGQLRDGADPSLARRRVHCCVSPPCISGHRVSCSRAAVSAERRSFSSRLLLCALRSEKRVGGHRDKRFSRCGEHPRRSGSWRWPTSPAPRVGVHRSPSPGGSLARGISPSLARGGKATTPRRHPPGTVLRAEATNTRFSAHWDTCSLACATGRTRPLSPLAQPGCCHYRS